MKTPPTTVSVVLLVLIAASANARKPIPEATPLDLPIPKGAVHIVAKAGDAEVKQVFTYFPYPPPPIDARNRTLPIRRYGVFRIEVTPEGNVAAVTILKSMGRSLDFGVLKTLARWRAKPGPLRVVDVNFTFWASGVSRGSW